MTSTASVADPGSVPGAGGDVGTARPPGRPRSSRADEAIVSAVLDLLAEGSSVESVSIEAIAARAGVGKATIYRRWPGKEPLLVDALRTLKGAPPALPGESVRDDLVMLLGVVGYQADERTGRVMSALGGHCNRTPDQERLYQEIMQPRRNAMRGVLRRGMANGELRADLDVELMMAMLTGPLLMHRILRPLPDLDEGNLPERVVDTLLAGIAGPG